LLIGLAASQLPAIAAANYFPLAAGNRWVYRDTTSGQTHAIEVMIPIMHNGLEYNKVTGYAAGPLYLRQTENGNIFAYDEEREAETLVTGFEVVDGGWYDTPISGCEQGAQPQSKHVGYKPPMGAEIPALQVVYRNYGCADAGFEQELYAQNIGLVRRTVTTIAGPRTLELIHARIGAITYESERGTSFRVFLDRNWVEQNAQKLPETLRVTMGVSLHSAPWMELRFAPGPQYDIRVRDDRGNVVYQWSEDVVTADPQPGVVVSRDTDFVQEIPLQMRGGEPLRVGYYTVEAWLNTEERQFAAATRFYFGPAE
jgi:hypothetical protein